MIADHYFTSGGYFTSHSVFLLYNQSNLSVISFTQQTDKLELRLSALVSRLINWNLQRGAHPEQRCHLRTSAPASVGISIEFRASYPHTDCPFCAVSRNSSTKSSTSNQGIATPVYALARNDREFDKFQFIFPQIKLGSPGAYNNSLQQPVLKKTPPQEESLRRRSNPITARRTRSTSGGPCPCAQT